LWHFGKSYVAEEIANVRNGTKAVKRRSWPQWVESCHSSVSKSLRDEREVWAEAGRELLGKTLRMSEHVLSRAITGGPQAGDMDEDGTLVRLVNLLVAVATLEGLVGSHPPIFAAASNVRNGSVPVMAGTGGKWTFRQRWPRLPC
jgi:hypothetical protein